MVLNFAGQFYFLSNFSPSVIRYDRREWDSAEHVFQAMKTRNKEQQEEVRLAHTPGEAKRVGRRVVLRRDWEEVKDKIMADILFEKFRQNPELLERLLSTNDDALVEGNNWCDNYWGRCFCGKCYLRRAEEPNLGRNRLGELLMDTRDIFRKPPWA